MSLVKIYYWISHVGDVSETQEGRFVESEWVDSAGKCEM